jgi:hypothetical protein
MMMLALPLLLVGAVAVVGIVIGVIAVVIFAAREERAEK